MSTPKRRKTNGYKSSPQAVGSLDFFFSKSKNGDASNKPDTDASVKTPAAPASLDEETGAQNHSLTDEELARKLQIEWNQQDRVRSQRSAHCTQEDNVGTESRDNGDIATEVEQTTSIDLKDKDGNVGERKQSVLLGSQAQIGNKTDTLALQSTASAEDAVSSTVPFDENPLTFDPTKYLPGLKAHWASQGGEASYGLLTRCFILVNSTQSRIKIVDTLVNFLRTVIEGDPESLLPAVGHLLSVLSYC